MEKYGNDLFKTIQGEIKLRRNSLFLTFSTYLHVKALLSIDAYAMIIPLSLLTTKWIESAGLWLVSGHTNKIIILLRL